MHIHEKRRERFKFEIHYKECPQNNGRFHREDQWFALKNFEMFNPTNIHDISRRVLVFFLSSFQDTKKRETRNN